MPTTPPTDGTSTVTVGGITAAVVADPYRKGESIQGGPFREIVYQVAWSSSDAFMDGLMAQASSSGGPGGTITRTTPHRYPGNTNLFCTSVEGQPVGVPMPGAKLYAVGDGQGGEGFCHVLARYEVPRIDFDGSQTNMAGIGPAYPFSKKHYSSQTKIIHLPPGSVKMAGSGFNPSRPFDFRLHEEIIEWTFFFVPFVNPPPFRLLAKGLNNAIFDGWARGCVMFDTYDFDEEIAGDGTWTINAVLRFVARNVDWNKMPKEEDATPVTGTGWDTANGSLSGAPVYPYVDFSVLFPSSS